MINHIIVTSVLSQSMLNRVLYKQIKEGIIETQ